MAPLPGSLVAILSLFVVQLRLPATALSALVAMQLFMDMIETGFQVAYISDVLLIA